MPRVGRLGNLLHPVDAAKAAKARVAAQIDMWAFGRKGRQRFRGDARYDLSNVTNGFRSHIEEGGDDTALLKRICVAYKKAVERQRSAPAVYEGPATWRELRVERLQPFIRALTEGNSEAFGPMLRNFYRDPCSSGLLAPPHGMHKEYFGPRIKNIYSHYYLTHVLSRLDYWKEVTGGRFHIKDLEGPRVGNPFGAVIDGTHVGVGSEYSHYCAHRVIGLLRRRTTMVPTVAEIGGGFGAIAYYLLRDQQPITYVCFDFPERIALSSYYLLKAFPNSEFLLFGEKQLTRESVGQSEVVLLPSFAIAEMPLRAVDVTFSSLAFGLLSTETMREYLTEIDRVTRDTLLVIDNHATGDLLKELIDREHASFRLAEKLCTAWHSRGVAGAGRRNGSGAASSELVEQCFSRALSAAR